MINKIHNQDCLTGLKALPDNYIDCCVTSPPYYGLRDYGTAKWEGGNTDCKHTYEVKRPYNQNFNERWGNAPGQKKQESQRHEKQYTSICSDCGAKRVDSQIGLEETPESYVNKMVEVFTEVRRVLKKDGTLWLNLGDSYNASNVNRTGQNGYNDGRQNRDKRFSNGGIEGLKPKDLIGIPWMVAFALRSSGWYLRQDIIWHKPNPMPESVTDRCTKAHEYIFLLSKSKKYYYDADSITIPAMFDGRKDTTLKGGGKYKDLVTKKGTPNSFSINEGKRERWKTNKHGIMVVNKRSVWTIPTKPYNEAHFATFPPALIIDCIKAGCPENGIVLDPFMGAGTTAVVSFRISRNFIGFELNEKYIQIAEKRIEDEFGVFNKYSK